MSYQRVIPRDFFSGSMLLQSLGRLSEIIHIGGDVNGECPCNLQMFQPDEDEHFVVHQNPNTGHLYCAHGVFVLNGEPMDLTMPFYSVYTADDKYPLYLERPEDSYKVLDSEGDLTKEFRDLCARLLTVDDDDEYEDGDEDDE